MSLYDELEASYRHISGLFNACVYMDEMEGMGIKEAQKLFETRVVPLQVFDQGHVYDFKSIRKLSRELYEKIEKELNSLDKLVKNLPVER